MQLGLSLHINHRRRRFTHSVPSITHLFTSDEQGAWYDPSDMSTMWQDSEGTIPVTASGQPVGRMLDKSGYGNHLEQITPSKRPIYTTDGSLSWLQYSVIGANAHLVTVSPMSMNTTNKLSMFAGLRLEDSETSVITEFSSSSSLNASSFTLYRLQHRRGISAYSRGLISVSATQGAQSTSISDVPVSIVVSSTHNIPTSITVLRINGAVEGVGANGNKGTGNFGTYPLFIGSRGGTSLNFLGRDYGQIILGRIATEKEILAIEAYLSDKTGI